MSFITRKPLSTPLPKLTEIEEKTMNLWLSLGTIWVTSVGQENVYFVDEFDNEFYCKCYPQ
jgi:hypothetical protein